MHVCLYVVLGIKASNTLGKHHTTTDPNLYFLNCHLVLTIASISGVEDGAYPVGLH